MTLGKVIRKYRKIKNLTQEEMAVRLGVTAPNSLIGFYMRKKQYGEAEKYLEYFSTQNPERKRKQAQIYAETGRIKDAYRAYEELLFTDYQRVSQELQDMYMLALRDDDRQKAHRLVEKQAELAKCFEMGRYYEVAGALDLATLEEDADAVVSIMEEVLSCADQIGDFRNSPLYEHMDFKKVDEDFTSELRDALLESFRDEESYGFLKDNKRWRKLVGKEFSGLEAGASHDRGGEDF